MPKTPPLSGENTARTPNVYSEIRLVRELSAADDNAFNIVPDAANCADIVRQLGLIGLKKLRFNGVLRPQGRADWRLTAQLGASVQQSCVVTSEPVNTRLDVAVNRLFLEKFEPTSEQSDDEFDGNDEIELLESQIDLGAILTEALALAIPQYPRKSGATLENAVFSPPNTTPMRDEDTKPFAGLAALRDKLND